ncbi:MAG: hypothetical protein ACFWTJ_03845 [Lachnoclostridium sp.]
MICQYGYESAKKFFESVLASNNKTTIRCNTEKITTEDLKKILKENQIAAEDGTYLPCALKISNYNYLADLESFKKGYFLIQDESSMLVGAVSGVKKYDMVIDVCAAPGGKSLHIAELLQSTGHVDARDLSESKVNLIRENINRLVSKYYCQDRGCPCLDKESIDKADIVIADLPCSGLGVIGKKPDIKYNMTMESKENL